MFSIDRFIEACRSAVATADAEATVENLVAEAVFDPASVVRALREPERAGFEVLHGGPGSDDPAFRLGAVDVFQGAQPQHVVGGWYLLGS